MRAGRTAPTASRNGRSWTGATAHLPDRRRTFRPTAAWAVTLRSFARQSLVTPGRDAGGHPPQLDEALRQRLVEHVVGVVRRQVVVVERRRASPAGDDGTPAVQRHPDLAADVHRGFVEKGVERPLERREPQAVVDELCPALLDAVLEPREIAFDGDTLELLVRSDECDPARPLVALAPFDADEPVLDHVEPADAVRPGADVELL